MGQHLSSTAILWRKNNTAYQKRIKKEEAAEPHSNIHCQIQHWKLFQPCDWSTSQGVQAPGGTQGKILTVWTKAKIVKKSVFQYLKSSNHMKEDFCTWNSTSKPEVPIYWVVILERNLHLLYSIRQYYASSGLRGFNMIIQLCCQGNGFKPKQS